MLKPVTEYKCETLQTARFHYIVNMSKFSGSFHKTAKVLFCHKKKLIKLRTYLYLYILPHQLHHGQQDWKHFTSIHIDEVENLPLLVHSASPSTAWTARFGSILLASILIKLRTYLYLYILPHQLHHGQQDWKHFTSIHIDKVENLPLLVHSASPSTAWTAYW